MSNAHTFRTVALIEDQMIRATMPRTNAADPKLTVREQPVRTWQNGRLVAAVAPLTFTLAEVVHV